MTYEAGLMLVNQIAPLIQGAVPRVARPVGCEDAEELVQLQPDVVANRCAKGGEAD